MFSGRGTISHLEAIYNLSKKFMIETDIKKICNLTLDELEKILNYDSLDIFLIDKERKALVEVAQRGKIPLNTVIPLYGKKGITAYAARTGKSLIVDVEKDSRYIKGLENARSEICVPLKFKGEILGVIDAESGNKNAFGEKDLKILEVLASFLGIAIKNAQLFEKNLQRIHELETMNYISRKISQYYRLDDLLKKICEIIHEKFNVIVVDIALVEGRKLDFRYISGDYKKRVENYPQEVKQGLIGWGVYTGKTLYEKDVTKSKRYIKVIEETRSELVIPIRSKERVIGALDLQSSLLDGFSKEDILMLESIADQIGISIENAKLVEKMAKSLEMTEFYNDLLSHDITNTVHIARGYLELLKKTEIFPQQKKYINSAFRAIESIGRLIENVKKFKKVHDRSYLIESVCPAEYIREICKVYEAHPEKNIRINLDLKDQKVKGTILLKDVFENLINNAIKYTLDNKVVIEIKEEDMGEYVKFCVIDRGKGIPDGYKDDLWNFKGSRRGLGLYLVKNIIESVDGKIWVENRKKNDHTKGSKFCVLFEKAKN